MFNISTTNLTISHQDIMDIISMRDFISHDRDITEENIKSIL